jgi:cellulose synthase/poly-beta-1,6-N-acetylglucosamine synthase-like glycosyltransferase
VKTLLEDGKRTGERFQKLVIVASDCLPETVAMLKSMQEKEDRIDLLVEDVRYGKADAVNKILSRAEAPQVLFANSDARPQPGAIASLLEAMEADQHVGAVSAIPQPEDGAGLMSLVLNFMWSAHNNCSIALNHMNVSNHSCDELVLFRTKAITFLPRNTVNDGAYLAAIAKMRGYAIKVSTKARVRISTPSRIIDIILQRRRILFGHAQVWRKVGTPPKTIESLLFLSPVSGMRLLVRTVSEKPRYLMALPVAALGEAIAALLSIYDTIRSSKSHAIWRRFV